MLAHQDGSYDGHCVVAATASQITIAQITIARAFIRVLIYAKRYWSNEKVTRDKNNAVALTAQKKNKKNTRHIHVNVLATDCIKLRDAKVLTPLRSCNRS